MDTGATVTQIGKYPILGVLGVGGMGVVYRGMDKSVGREVAIKTLTEATEELRQRFLLEARSGVLNHPNIVTVYDFGEQDGNPYIVMEFVPGDSLENLLRDGRQFSLIEKLEIIRQICSGLGYAHQKGVIHRDIKPANIMVQPDGNIKIVDFGVARLESHSAHTQTGMVIGTFHYISPERLLGRTADGRADVWSVGVILYLLLTGRLPFPGDDPATLHRVIREPHPPLSALLADYPQALDHLIDRVLAKDPIDRYETAEEMAADIEAVNDGLKREHVAEVLDTVMPMMEKEQWSIARTLLLDLQRLNPQNSEVKKLLREVQERVSRQQKTARIQQLLGEAEEAVLSQRYSEALEFYNQAAGIDRTNPEIPKKAEHVRGLKERAEHVASLLEQAREARKRSDFETASELIENALQLDERNTDLRNERARIVQESERIARERARLELSEAAKNQLAARQYTEAIRNLRSALEIDPTDSETQKLYQSAIERQEEQRRRKIIDQIIAEISESISGESFDRALTLIQRAQERLPGETALLQLKAEAEARQREQTARKLVESTLLETYDLLPGNPQAAFEAVQRALKLMPGELQLIALQEKIVQLIKKAGIEEIKIKSLKRAQTAIDANQFDGAIQILENAVIQCGELPDIASLLDYAREQKRRIDQNQRAANANRDAQALIAAGQFEAAIALLKPVAFETGDASVEQLLRLATASLADQNRRVEAALSRARSLSENSIDEALQLLVSQPQEVQQHPQARELFARLSSGKEQERLTLEAIRDAGNALDKRDLGNVLNGLESVRRAYGDSPQVASAIADYKTKRAQLANELLSAAIASGTQAIQQDDRARAAEELDRAAVWAEFADAGLQTSLKRLTREAGRTKRKKGALASAAPDQKKPGLPRAVLIAGIAVLVLAITAVAFWFLRTVPAVPLGALELNATPFAEVVSVSSEKGITTPLPAGDHWTPMRIEGLPTGRYVVSFKGSDGSMHTQPCDVAQTARICQIELAPVNDNAIEQIIGGSK